MAAAIERLLKRGDARLARMQRLFRVQQWLKQDDGNGGEHNVHSVIAVLGIDGRFNRGSRQLVNYLIFGLAKSELDSEVKGCQASDVLDDVVLIVKPRSVDVICNKEGLDVLLPMISGWPNLRVHCLTGRKASDQETVEEFKLHSFVKATKGLQSIGFSLFGAAAFEVIEKWPLIQAFAHEESGGGGFFSLVHNPIDVTTHIDKIFEALDAINIEHVLYSQVPRFCKQWEAFAARLGTFHEASVYSVVLENILQDFQVFWEHGLSVTTSPVSTSISPMVSLYHIGGAASLNVDGSGPIVSCHLADPCGPLRCARTAISNGNTIQNTIYDILIELAYRGIDLLGNPSSSQYLDSKAVCAKLVELFAELTASTVPPMTDSSFSWIGYDGFSCSISRRTNSGMISEDKLNIISDNPLHGLLYFELHAAKLPFGGPDDGNYCEVVYGETFTWVIDEHTNTERPFIVTSNIAKFFPVAISVPIDTESIFLDDPVFDKLGLPLTEVPSKAQLLHYGQAFEVVLFYFERGVVIRHSVFGNLQFAFVDDELDVIQHERLQTGFAATQVLHVSNASESILHISSQTDPANGKRWGPAEVQSFLLRMSAHTDSSFLRVVWSTWISKNIDSVNFLTSDTVSEVLCKHIDPDQFFLNSGIKVSPIAYGGMLENFLFCGTDASRSRRPELQQKPQKSNTRVPLTILTGIPGSGKARASASIVALTKQSTRWFVLRPELEWGIDFHCHRIQEQLEHVVGSWKSYTSPTESEPKKRLLLITAGFVHVGEVIQAILSHPNEAVREAIRIASVSCCVDPKNTFMEHNLAFPFLLEQCADGWCNSILLTGEGASPDQMNRVVTLLRSNSPSAAIIRCEDGRVMDDSGFDVLLSESAFDEPSARRKRWISLGCCDKDIDIRSLCDKAPFASVCLQFSVPLKLELLQARIANLIDDSKHKIFRIKGRTLLTSTEDNNPNWHKVHFVKQSKHISIVPMKLPENSAGFRCILLFIGIDVYEKDMKSLVQSCVREQQEQLPLRTRLSLTSTELEGIKSSVQHVPLPQGYFHNGRQYVCMDGSKSSDHPLLEKEISEWLEHKNDEIKIHNKLAASQSDDEVIFHVKHLSPVRPTGTPQKHRPSAGRASISAHSPKPPSSATPKPPSSRRGDTPSRQFRMRSNDNRKESLK